MRDSTLLPVIVRYLSGDPVTAFLIAALMTYLFHSSIAAVLLLVALAGKGVIGPELGVVMVLGVNLGSSFIAPILTRSAEPAFRIVPLGNLLMRGAGSVIVLVAFMILHPSVALLGATAADQIIHAHILFNLLILLAGIPLSGTVLKVTEAIVAMQTPVGEEPASAPADVEEASALNAGALDRPCTGARQRHARGGAGCARRSR